MNVLSNSSTGKGIKTSVKLDVKDVQKKLKSLEKRIAKINALCEVSSGSLNRTNRALHQVDSSNKRVASSARNIAKGYRDANSAVSILTKNLRTLASTYLGVMGAKAVTGASDTITSAENRLNQLNGNDLQQTQQTMDKMYASAQKARMSYSDMVANVSKSMTLAPDAFQGNIDNAIRFQEIMAEAYTLGGASAAEQHSSMYQMIQALGSGILQGDELRSVREGAPIAYQKIEEFAQGVFNTEESLKDLASQGMITSEIVVAAMMSAGEGIDKAFAQTKWTFAQAFMNMRNVALKSFEPVLQQLNGFLNGNVGMSIINGIGTALYVVAQALIIVFGWIEKIYNFVVTHWGTITKVIMTIASVIAIALLPQLIANVKYLVWSIYYYAVLGVTAVANLTKVALAWLATNWQIALVLVVLAAIVVAIIWVADSFVDACGIVVGAIFWVLGVIHNIIAFIINLVAAFFTFFGAILANMLVAVNNFVQGATVKFWEWVQECLNGTGMVAKAVSKIAEAFGLDAISIDTKINTAKGKMQEYTDIGEAVETAFNLTPYTDLGEMYDKGYGYGAKGGNWVTDKVGGVKDWFSNKFNMGGLEDIINPTASVGGIGNGYDPVAALENIGKGVGDTADNTGKIADSMELTQEDLEYLRRVADMEWKKEFTTANITVDMSNYNTISKEVDADGFFTKLTDTLQEELDLLANGVYA